jgi:hypothetical protein
MYSIFLRNIFHLPNIIQCSATPHIYTHICVHGFGILFRSVKFSVFSPKSLISALLRGLQKMAASKPIS